jgi:putative ABC transport system substrate-binding protein
MRRRQFISLLLAVVALRPAPLLAQRARIWRLGWLDPGSSAAHSENLEIFRHELKTLGYVEGRDLLIERRFSEGNVEGLRGLAEDLTQMNVDVILAVSSFAVQAAKAATTKIPIVMTGVGDPEHSGFVASITRPGGNITGLTNVSIDISSKYLELLHVALPTMKLVGAMIDPAHPNHPTVLRQVQIGAQAFGIEIAPIEVRNVEEIEAIFDSGTRRRVEALIVPPHPVWQVKGRRIVELTLKHRLPTMFGLIGAVEVGGLMSYLPSYADMYRRAAALVDKILKGAKPADLPVEFPTRFEFALNLRTADALGLQLPADLRVRADKIVD